MRLGNSLFWASPPFTLVPFVVAAVNGDESIRAGAPVHFMSSANASAASGRLNTAKVEVCLPCSAEELLKSVKEIFPAAKEVESERSQCFRGD